MVAMAHFFSAHIELFGISPSGYLFVPPSARKTQQHFKNVFSPSENKNFFFPGGSLIERVFSEKARGVYFKRVCVFFC